MALILLEMQLSPNSSDAIKGTLEKMHNYIQHMSQTIDDFRDFFKPEKEKKITNFDIIFTKAYKLIEATFEKTDIQLNVTRKSPENFKSYENELVQVVINILNNAADALQERKIPNPTIKVKIGSNFITIEDNAGGIADEIITKIFEPYSSTKSKNGTGLGLYMSQIIVQKHCNGKLEVKNSQNGAKFTISLPTNKEEK